MQDASPDGQETIKTEQVYEESDRRSMHAFNNDNPMMRAGGGMARGVPMMGMASGGSTPNALANEMKTVLSSGNTRPSLVVTNRSSIVASNQVEESAIADAAAVTAAFNSEHESILQQQAYEQAQSSPHAPMSPTAALAAAAASTKVLIF